MTELYFSNKVIIYSIDLAIFYSMSLKWALNTLRYENGNRKQQPTKPLTNKKCPFSTQSLNQHSRVRLSASIRACATLGHFPFVQIMSREQTVAMETVVSDAVSKATPTCVEERTKLNILWGSQAPAATHTHTVQDSGKQIKGFYRYVIFFLSQAFWMLIWCGHILNLGWSFLNTQE